MSNAGDLLFLWGNKDYEIFCYHIIDIHAVRAGCRGGWAEFSGSGG